MSKASELEREVIIGESGLFKADFVGGIFTGKDKVHDINMGIAREV